MASFVINNRADLESIAGTKKYHEFMARLKGTMTRKQNIAEYPENYGMPDYDGPAVEPIWEGVEDLTTIEGFGFTKGDFT